MKENMKRAWFIIAVIVVIFMAYVSNTYEEPRFIIEEKNITVEDLSNSPFMDHTHDIKNLVDPHRPVITHITATVA